ncbi:DedA family protein [Croceicoccus sp. F390]|uniref:DedA family protein n=1 Tax=Croceicoccus esteveae TaxID=3075597 RepID=A0ABU2ZG38_9SPHN|nr:DedA family protein [Croceicoccus sp. F390]MDT0575548.1 DedA family protein [Croceicoccus sp. F390]
MTGWIIDLIEGGGYFGIALLMALENIFPPLPSEIIMAVGGLAVAEGRMAFWPLLFWSTIGTTLGNYAWYLLGNRLGYERMKPFVDRHGRWLTVDWRQVENTSRFFRKWGQWVVFFLRFSPLMRTMVSLPAGLAHMNVWKFLIYTFAGSAIWNGALIAGAGLLAGWFRQFEDYLSGTVIVLVVLMVGFYVYRVLTWKPRIFDEE